MTKDGYHKGVQRYKCAGCGKRFVAGSRLNKDLLWEDYIERKQTYLQLSIKYSSSIKIIQRKIDAIKTQKETTFPAVVNVLVDTTYFSRRFGVMVFKDSLSGQILYKQYVKQEINKLYLTVLKK